MKRLLFINLLHHLIVLCPFYLSADSSLSAETAPPVITNQLPAYEIVQGANRLGFDLFQDIKTHKGNICYSPFSISSGLAMVASASNSPTTQQLQQLIHYTLNFLPIHKELERYLFSPSVNPQSPQVFLANSLWVEKEIPINPTFTKKFSDYFIDAIQQIDSQHNKGGTAQQINRWTAQKTNNKITQIIEPKNIDEKTQFILSTALTFKGQWQYPFDSQKTRYLPFYISNRSYPTNMMETSAFLFHGQDETFTWVILPYTSQPQDTLQLAFMVIVPNEESHLTALEAQFNRNNWQKWIKTGKQEWVKIQIPRFRIDMPLDLLKVLNDKKVDNIATSQANYQTLTTEKDFFLNRAFHKGYLQVEEGGTEYVRTMNKNAREENIQKELMINRPFFFTVFDQKTETIFLMGRFSAF